MSYWLPLVFAAAYLLGTVAHELTHWIAVQMIGGTVREMRVLPPNPVVVFDVPQRLVSLKPVGSCPAIPHTDLFCKAPVKAADGFVRVAPVVASVPLLVGAFLLLRDQPLWLQIASVVFLFGYIPRSATDWEPIVQMV